MPEVWAGSLGEERAITTADGGTDVVGDGEGGDDDGDRDGDDGIESGVFRRA